MRAQTAFVLLFPLCLGADSNPLGAGGDPLASAPQFLPVDEAFVFSARIERPRAASPDAPGPAQRRLVARWDMPAGYYLYKHRFAVVAGEGGALGPAVIPDGKEIVDDYFGESEVYYGSVEIAVPVLGQATKVVAEFHYQGCADYGLCYPPQVRSVAFDSADGVVRPGADVAEGMRRIVGKAEATAFNDKSGAHRSQIVQQPQRELATLGRTADGMR